ncbi:MAG TPA: cytochrome d ubiquinol oxidase subunit II [Bacteroidales bacterium]|nr:cytochrome d ubiquinol oxidase subunit II [Bacteroidales bacterium]HSA44846.1 cytochrome d ubiquinol oxidase subunit II [Bacteroidales bacterium]
MFETLSHLALQQYWWVIVSLLAGLLVFLLFVQGGQTLIYILGKTETEQKLIVNSLGRKWEFTFTTLVTFGGAFFASFPLFYSTSFGGAYWVWIAILFCFIVQAVSYEFRSKPSNFLGRKTYDVFLFINGLLGTLLLGTAVSTFFTGSMFSVNKLNITTLSNPVISAWETPWHGLEAALNIQNLALGLAIFFLARVLGILYIINNIGDKNIFARARKNLWYNAIPFLVFFLFWLIRLLFLDGYAYDPATKNVFMEEHKYLNNFLQMPLNTVIFLIGVLGVLWGTGKSLFSEWTKGIWCAGGGTVLTVFALFLLAGFNHTAFYPSSFDLQSSLTIENSSSSKYTLTVMSYVSLLVPFVIAYIFWAWRSINRKRIDAAELEQEHHAY